MNIERKHDNPIDLETVASIMTNTMRFSVLKRDSRFLMQAIESIKEDLLKSDQITSRPTLASYATSAILNGEINDNPNALLSMGIKNGTMAPLVGILITELRIMDRLEGEPDFKDPNMSFAKAIMSLSDEELLLGDRTGSTLFEEYIYRAEYQSLIGKAQIGVLPGVHLSRDVYKMIYPLTAKFAQ